MMSELKIYVKGGGGSGGGVISGDKYPPSLCLEGMRISRNIPVKIASSRAGIGTWDFLNAKQEFCETFLRVWS
jgi:hypothetical protein